jgi:gamma-glutamylcyclotransferase (GGCT)/AIG2-like uncharacterized protein YtfP
MGGAFERLLESASLSVSPAMLYEHALYGWGLPYPFVRSEAGHRVVGDLIELDPALLADVLRAVDEYEGPEYQRVVLDIDADGQRVSAIVYLADPTVELAEDNRVPSGDWMMPF